MRACEYCGERFCYCELDPDMALAFEEVARLRARWAELRARVEKSHDMFGDDENSRVLAIMDDLESGE